MSQLQDVGLSRRAVQHRARAGRLHRAHRGVYSVGTPALTIEARWAGGLLACGRGGILGLVSAGVLWEWIETDGDVTHLVAERSSGSALPGVRLHRTQSLPSSDRTWRRGLPLTSAPRTLLDLASVLDDSALEGALNEAIIRRAVTLTSLERRLASEKGRRGVARLRTFAGLAGAGVTRSQLERRFAALVRGACLADYERNVRMTIAGRRIVADAVWVGRRVIVELDGRDVHTIRRAFHADRDRDFALAVEGWTVIRLTWRHVTTDAVRTAERLARLLA